MGKIDDYDIRGIPQEQVDLNDDIRTIINFGKYQSATISAAPGWTGRRGESVYAFTADSGYLYVCTSDDSVTWRVVSQFPL